MLKSNANVEGNPYVVRGIMTFRLSQIIFNLIVIIIMCGLLYWYFNSYPDQSQLTRPENHEKNLTM